MARNRTKGVRGSRNNCELYTPHNEPKLTSVVIRLRCAGHVQCKAEQQKPKRLLHAKITCKRKVGRPKSRWSDVVNGDTRKLEIKRGKEEIQTETGGENSNWKPRLFASCRAMMMMIYHCKTLTEVPL